MKNEPSGIRTTASASTLTRPVEDSGRAGHLPAAGRTPSPGSRPVAGVPAASVSRMVSSSLAITPACWRSGGTAAPGATGVKVIESRLMRER